MRKVVFMIDGWFMRKQIYAYKTFYYSGPEIRKYCLQHLRKDDYLYRIFYYDTEPLNKKGHSPISKHPIDFSTTQVAQEQSKLLDSIKTTPNFALRLGKTIWKNNDWILKADKLQGLLNKTISINQLKDDDFKPLIRQKAVDIKLGLDIAWIAMERLADLLIVITGDADIVPVLKFARRHGMQVCLDPLRNPVRPELSEHVDFIETHIPSPRKSLKKP